MLSISSRSKTYSKGGGKSTLMRTIATLQEPDSGAIQFDDYDVVTPANASDICRKYRPSICSSTWPC